MSAAFVIVNTAMGLFDLGIFYAIYRVYRWASTPEPRPKRQPAPAPIAPRRQTTPGLADLA